MSRKTQNVIIGLIAGTMLFSSIGTGLLLLAQDDGSSLDSALSSENQPETETPTTDPEQIVEPTVDPAEIPEAFIPEGEVTDLIITDLDEGQGDKEVEPSSEITVNYHGTLASDGSEFDSSYRRGTPASFPLTGVIQGWQEGLLGMKEGGRRRLIIPSELAYGPSARDGIPANSALVFEVELLSIDN